MNSMYMILADTNLSSKEVNKMVNDINQLDGITFALSLDSVVGNELPQDFIPSTIRNELKGDNHQIMMVASDYKIASDEINTQIDAVDAIAKNMTILPMVIGEAPCTKDLITITDTDFKNG